MILLPDGFCWDEKRLHWNIRRNSTKEVVASARAAEINLDLTKPLPETGWREIVSTSAAISLPNCLCMYDLDVDPTLRFLVTTLIHRAKAAAKDRGIKVMVSPVALYLKHLEPEREVMDYVWQCTESGEIYDPWIRAHVQTGGRIENVASDSEIWIRWDI